MDASNSDIMSVNGGSGYPEHSCPELAAEPAAVHPQHDDYDYHQYDRSQYDMDRSQDMSNSMANSMDLHSNDDGASGNNDNNSHYAGDDDSKTVSDVQFGDWHSDSDNTWQGDEADPPDWDEKKWYMADDNANADIDNSNNNSSNNNNESSNGCFDDRRRDSFGGYDGDDRGGYPSGNYDAPRPDSRNGSGGEHGWCNVQPSDYNSDYNSPEYGDRYGRFDSGGYPGDNEKGYPFPPAEDDNLVTPWPGMTFHVLEAGTNRALTLLDTGGGEVALQDRRDHPNPNNQWQLVEKDGYYGLYNPRSHTYLGRDGYGARGGIRATARVLQSWELFMLRPVPTKIDGFHIVMPHWWHTMTMVTLAQDGEHLARTMHGNTVWQFAVLDGAED